MKKTRSFAAAILVLSIIMTPVSPASAYMPEGADDINGTFTGGTHWLFPEGTGIDSRVPEAIETILSSERRFSSATVNGISEILQYPELPNGCESVALTIVLKSLGFNMSKRAIADNWLIKNHNMAAGYSGDPSNESGLSVFTTGLMLTAEDFLESAGSECICYDLDGTELSDLLKFIEEGHPVIVWSTVGMEMPVFSGKVYRYDGKSIEWYFNEHCVVLYGFDTEKGVLMIADPIDGLVERDLERFTEVYNKAGKMAMVII